MTLPDRSREVDRLERLTALLRPDHPLEPLEWVARPWILALAGSRLADPVTGHRTLTRPLRMRQRARFSVAGAAEPPLGAAVLAGGALFIAATENQGRAQHPVALGLGSISPISRRLVRRPPGARALQRSAAEVCSRMLDEIRAAGLESPFGAGELHWVLMYAARCLASARTALEAIGPDVVVVGSMHGAPARALSLVARELRIPSVYLPHAPAIARAYLADLPVDYAGLRGPRELDLYGEWGADPSKLEVVGNPALEPADPPAIDEALPPVFAPSPQGDTQEGELIELASEVLDQALVTPHPRSNLNLLGSLAPEGWRIWDGRTYDLLRRGPPAVIQHGSGVALEALGLGIPVIELVFPGKPPNYPFAREPYVHLVSDARALADAVAACRRDAADPARRRQLVEWAREWSWPAGEEAAERGVALVRSAAGRGPRPAPIWDFWSG